MDIRLSRSVSSRPRDLIYAVARHDFAAIVCKKEPRLAKPEWKWSVPPLRFAVFDKSLHAQFINADQVLMSYGGYIVMWNLKDRRAEYIVPSESNELTLSPGRRYLCINPLFHAFLIDIQTGGVVAGFRHQNWARFSRDSQCIVVDDYPLAAYPILSCIEPCHLFISRLVSSSLLVSIEPEALADFMRNGMSSTESQGDLTFH